ncbi:uncharacterized protein EI90DRAFT_3029329 [Cantharellus anzutake]|uniref:uncharacterized protein n=1 Tax=Cantharellus anzutake TaxID=1750568 RepID=UPI0019041404|nr:uncharacterized protein EI90DRAFT_3029329 [Cantharellus anzutake]KAF8344340.1 hypothetical protein EI90DRAFT_3029329 [Cantharellus anzutake]
MARGRNVRRKVAPSEPKSSVADTKQEADSVENESTKEGSPETCPLCESHPRKASKKENWVGCEGCERWFHWSCVNQPESLDSIDKWFCAECLVEDPSRSITFKPDKGPTRKSRRTTTKVDYATLNEGVHPADPKRWMHYLATKRIVPHAFPTMKGSEVTSAWLTENEDAMTQPIIIEEPEGLGMKMPDPSFTVSDVARMVGEDEKVEVLDVGTQREDKGWTLGKWADYYNSPPRDRDKIRNVISLEISETKLAEKILPPRLVRQIDWVEQAWPVNKRKGQYPKVQLYCLMSVAQCWTDWHLDFAGSSVYYHILRGSKVFYFIRPTPANLAAYEKWSGSEVHQSNVWLGDWVDEVVKVELQQGNTMIIPTGWIHCVYTPTDSLVFGGNFLHSWNIATQLRVRQLELATKVPKKFRFPMFRKLCWYVAEKMVRDIKAKEEIHPRILSGLEALATFLVNEVHIIERKASTEAARKDSKDQVPTTTRDPSSLARELRWRVRLALGSESGDELETPLLRGSYSTNGINGHEKRSSVTPGAVAGVKRKRGRGVSQLSSSERGPIFRGYEPRPWDVSEMRKIQPVQTVQVSMLQPGLEDSIAWADSNAVIDPSSSSTPSSSRVEYTSAVDEVVKVRKTLRGDVVTILERETIRRVYERWEFAEDDDAAETRVKEEESVDPADEGAHLGEKEISKSESVSPCDAAPQNMVDANSPPPEDYPIEPASTDQATEEVLMDVDDGAPSPHLPPSPPVPLQTCNPNSVPEEPPASPEMIQESGD